MPDTGGILNFSTATFPLLQCGADPTGNTTMLSQETVEGRTWGTTNYLINYHVVSPGEWHQFNFGRTDADSPFPRPVRTAELRDGLSTTILFGEGYSMCDGTPRLALLNTQSNGNPDNWRPWYDCFGIDWQKRPNTYLFQAGASEFDCNNWRAQSGHTGGMNIALCDGSVKFITDQLSTREIVTTRPAGIEYGVNARFDNKQPWGVWDRLLLPRDGETLDSRAF